MSLLNKLASLPVQDAPKKVTIIGHQSVPMTKEEITATREFIKKNQLGQSVQANQHDRARPYRVSITLKSIDSWENFGQYKSKDAAAAIGTIVSLAYFGERAKAGKFDVSVVETSEEYANFIADPRNTDIIARAEGTKETKAVYDPEYLNSHGTKGGYVLRDTPAPVVEDFDDIPF
jgi:hypothetical protein